VPERVAMRGSLSSAAAPSRASAWSRRGDRTEREATTLAEAALGRPAAGPIAAPRRAAPTVGAPLSTDTREFFEPRFGHDFSRVRVIASREAAAASRAANARAYTLDQQIVWGSPAHPESPQARPLLAHELAHIAAGHTAAAPTTAFRDPLLPDDDQQRLINEKFNPQQSEGPSVPEVTDPVGFTNALKARAAVLRAGRLATATAVQSSSVSLTTTDKTDVTTIAASRIRTAFQGVLAPGIDLDAIRAGIRYIPSDPGTAPAADEATLSAGMLGGLDRSSVDTVVLLDGPASTAGTSLDIIRTFHVLAGGRDSTLYQSTLRAIVDEAPAAWRTIALSMRGWDTTNVAMLQRHIVPEGGESDATARRRGRWLNLGTSIHEILHAVTNPDFAQATFATENRRLGTEGFTEFFTRRVYGRIVSDAASDPALTLSIEGAPGPPAITPPPRTSYNDYFAQVQNIVEILGGATENLEQAYFRGRLEFIGLGHWNELHRGLPTSRRHAFGAALLFQTSGGTLDVTRPYVRADWGYLVLGHSGRVQLDLRAGAALTYLRDGDRIGLGPQITGTLRGSHLFLTGGALVQGSASFSGGVSDPRFDAVFRIEGGAQIGRFHLGPTFEVLVPINEPNAVRRSAQVFGGIGASFVIGE
jgi:Domain of unknown function (DUF4157)